MVSKVQQQTLSLRPIASLQSADTSFEWERYVTDVFEKFLSAFMLELDDAFEQLEFWMAFNILDPYKLTEKKKI